MTNAYATMTALVVALLATAACTKHDEAGKASGVPPLSNAAPATPTQPERGPAPPGGASAQGPEVKDPNATITGQVVVAAAVKDHVAPTDTLYIVARRIPDNPSARGSLVAVKKVSAGRFPIEFELSAADMPFQNGAFEGDLQLSVRDNKSGDPIMRRKGDVFGTLPKVRVGARDVKLTLDTLQKEDESLAGNMAPGTMPPGHPAVPPGHP